MDAQTGDQTAQQPKAEGPQATGESKPTARGEGRPIDGGWAWVVLVGAFTVYLTALGFSASLSVYLPVWMDYWEADAATTSLVMSIGVLWRGLMSPLSSALCTKFGPRTVTLVGGVITAGGATLMSLSPSITVLILLYLIPGLGVNLVFISTMQILSVYFHKRYTLAVGIALAGISAGQLAFPPLVTLCIDTYGWRGSILITAAITLHIVAAGALMRPLPRLKSPKTGTEEKAQKAVDESIKTESDSRPGHRVDTAGSEATGGSSDGSDATGNCNSPDEIDEDDSDLTDVAIVIPDSDELIEDGSPPPTEDYTGTLVAAIEEDGLAQVAEPDSVISDDKPTKVVGHISLRWSVVKHFLLEEYGLRRLVSNRRFMLMLIAYYLHGFGKLGITYIVARATSVGIDLHSSGLLLSLFGVGGLIGRIGPGWFIDKKYISAHLAYLLGLVAFSLSVALMPAFVAFGPLVAVAVLMGIAAGTSGALSMVLVRSLVQPRDATEALGIMMVFTAIGTLTGTLVGGLIYDNTKSYDIAFFTGAAILLVSTVPATAVYFLQRAHNKRPLPAARFWAKLPRRMKLSASYEVDPKPNGSQNGIVGVVNPLYTFTASGILESHAITTDSEGANVAAVNPLFESVEGLGLEETTTEASGEDCEPTPESPVGGACTESQPRGTDSLALNSAAILPSSTAPTDDSVCINRDATDSNESSDGSESSEPRCRSGSMDTGRGFENPGFDVEVTEVVLFHDDYLATDTTDIAEFDTDS